MPTRCFEIVLDSKTGEILEKQEFDISTLHKVVNTSTDPSGRTIRWAQVISSRVVAEWGSDDIEVVEG